MWVTPWWPQLLKKKVPESTEAEPDTSGSWRSQDERRGRPRPGEGCRGRYHLLTPNSELLNLSSWPATALGLGSPPCSRPPLTYILPLHPTSITPSHTYQRSRAAPPCPARSLLPPPPHPPPSSALTAFGARVGWGFWMGVSYIRNYIVGFLLTGGNVTHQRPCCTHATLPLHIIVARKHAHTGDPPLSGSIHNYLNNLSESCNKLC